jgi:hypothetical protein
MIGILARIGTATMRVLVCGGRDFLDRDCLFVELDALRLSRGVTVIISGCARGADTLGLEWAKARGIEVARFPADWEKHRRAAGPIRNQQMLDEGRPDLVIAFPGGRGTADMVGRATAAGIETIQL